MLQNDNKVLKTDYEQQKSHLIHALLDKDRLSKDLTSQALGGTNGEDALQKAQAKEEEIARKTLQEVSPRPSVTSCSKLSQIQTGNRAKYAADMFYSNSRIKIPLFKIFNAGSESPKRAVQTLKRYRIRCSLPPELSHLLSELILVVYSTVKDRYIFSGLASSPESP